MALLVAVGAQAQIFQQPYTKKLKKAEQKANDLLSGGADFVLDPIETVPQGAVTKFRAEAAETNWGVNLVLPADIRARIEAECTYKVTVKIADTGYPDHIAIKQGQLSPSNYTTDASANDGNGHSTHCTGIIVGDNGLGVCDALVDKALLKHKQVKILADNGSGSFDWVRNAIAAERSDDRARLGAGEFVVYSGSFGGGTGIIANVDAELKASTDLGILFCFAAGNTGTTGVNYPGNSQYSIAVASLDQSGVRSSYSTMGPEVWVAMPGRGINSTYKGNTYATLSGTSMATPFATSAVIIALSKWGAQVRSVGAMKNYLAWCAKDITPAGKDSETGWGLELIKSILDHNPADAPNMGNPTPPPPGGGNPPPVRETRYLNFEIPGEYAVLWGTGQSSTGKKLEASTFRTLGRGSKASNRGLALEQTTITGLDVEVQSTTDAATEYTTALNNARWFFTNRGFQLPAGSDNYDALYWAGYFFEMILETQRSPQYVDVVRIRGKDAKGNPLLLTRERAKHWPVK